MSGALLKNTAWGVLGELATRGSKLVQVILMARVLGAEEIGRFNFALAIAGLFSMLFDFGAATMAVRDLARDPTSGALRLYGRLKLITSGAGVLLVCASAFLTSAAPMDRLLTFGIGLYVALNDFGSYVLVVYRAQNRFWRETAWRSLMSVLQLAGCVAAVFLTRRAEWVMVALIITALLGLLPLLGEWLKQPRIAASDAGSAGLARAARECAPIAATALVGAIYTNFDVVMLGRDVPMLEVGLYSVAVKTIFSLLIIPVHYFQLATLPAFAADIGRGLLPAVRARWLQSYVLSTTVGSLLFLLAAVFAREMLALMFGAEFAAGADVLVVFALIGYLFYLYTPVAQWLLLLGLQQWSFYVQGFAAGANVLLVIVCIPRFGMWGAVLAAGITHAVIALGNFAIVWRSGGFARHEPEWRSILWVTVGLTLAVLVLQAGTAWPKASRLLAVAVFALFARAELLSLASYLHARMSRLRWR